MPQIELNGIHFSEITDGSRNKTFLPRRPFFPCKLDVMIQDVRDSQHSRHISEAYPMLSDNQSAVVILIQILEIINKI